MSRPLAVFRPEPGNSATAARIEAAGREAIRMPLFEILPLAWQLSDPDRFDALVLTSANAVRETNLAPLRHLPVLAVGTATAEAARGAGLNVIHVGTADGAALVEAARKLGVKAALHLGGRERRELGPPVIHSVAVYASVAVDPPAEMLERLPGATALVHSPRAGSRLARLVDHHGLDRSEIDVAAISETALAAAGAGWRRMSVAAEPRDAALIAAATSD